MHLLHGRSAWSAGFLLSSIVLGTIGLVAGIRKELLGVEEQKAMQFGLGEAMFFMEVGMFGIYSQNQDGFEVEHQQHE